MAKVTAFLATGLEEVECLSVVDILRRAGVEVELVSATGERVVTGSHGIAVVTDRLLSEADLAASDVLFLPGGVPGVPNLEKNEGVISALKAQFAAGKRVAAICAAPSILGKLGFFDGHPFTCYPGWEKGIDGVNGARWTGSGVLTEGNVSTGRGLGCAIDFGLELVRVLCGEEKADGIRRGIQHPATF